MEPAEGYTLLTHDVAISPSSFTSHLPPPFPRPSALFPNDPIGRGGAHGSLPLAARSRRSRSSDRRSARFGLRSPELKSYLVHQVGTYIYIYIYYFYVFFKSVAQRACAAESLLPGPRAGEKKKKKRLVR